MKISTKLAWGVYGLLTVIIYWPVWSKEVKDFIKHTQPNKPEDDDKRR